MPGTDRLPAEWPEKIYYVCNSSFSTLVNAIPIIHAGADRIVGMQILCGVRDPGKPTLDEERHSIRPADRLKEFAEEKIRGIDVAPHTYADPDSFVAWGGALRQAIETACDNDCTLVYNATGGTKDMVLGSLLGLRQADRAKVMVISISKADRTCIYLDFDDTTGCLEERLLGRKEQIDLDELLRLCGYVEVDKEEREEHEKFIQEHRGVAESVLKAAIKISQGGHKSTLGALQWQMQNRQPPFSLDFRDIRADKGSLRCLLESFSGLAGFTIKRGARNLIDSIEVENETARCFVGGIWLEAVILGVVKDIFKDASIEIYGGFKLAVKETRIPGQNTLLPDMELDIAFLIDEQLHSVEVKAVTTGQGFGQYTPKIFKMREELGTHRMRTFLVAPFLEQSDIEGGDFMSRTKQQGVELYYGYDGKKKGRALNILEKKLYELKQDLRL